MKKTWKPYNLNKKILVQLDAKGEEILQKHYHGDGALFKSEDKEGFYEFQVYQFMDIFGGKGCGAYAPYSTYVFLEA